MDYTKGPWIWNESRNDKYFSALERKAELKPGEKRTVLVHQAQWPIYEADKNLIAASPEMYEALIGIGQIALLTEWPTEERMEWIEAKVNRILAKIGPKNILSILSKGRTPELMTALDELGIPVKDGDNLRSISDILDDLSIKWQELEGRPD